MVYKRGTQGSTPLKLRSPKVKGQGGGRAESHTEEGREFDL